MNCRACCLKHNTELQTETPCSSLVSPRGPALSVASHLVGLLQAKRAYGRRTRPRDPSRVRQCHRTWLVWFREISLPWY